MKKILYALLAFALLAYVVWSLGFLYQRGLLAESEGLDLKRMEKADSAIYKAIADGEIPGAVLCVVRRAADGQGVGNVAYLKAYGNRSVITEAGVADSIAMTTDVVFDLASLSKCTGTTLALMRLVEDGQLRLTDRVDRYIEDFKPWDSIAEQNSKKLKGKKLKNKKRDAKPQVVKREHITVKHLLTHTSGLPAYINVGQFMARFGECDSIQGALHDSLVGYIATEVERRTRPGDKVRYSCLNFIVLQAIIETITGRTLDEFAKQEVFDPMRLKNTWYHNLDSCNKPFDELTPIAPTELLSDGTLLCGEVHDSMARLINRGVSGNAGVFSTVEDLAVVASMLINGGVLRFPSEGWRGKLGFTEAVRLYSEQTINAFFRVPEQFENLGRALGWDAADDRGGCYGDLMTPDCVASHTGYTGTSMAIDYEQGVAVILLTNRVHPKDKGSLSRTRAVVSNIVMSALE